jgi:cytochrome P450
MVDVAIEFDPLSDDFFDDPYDTYRRLRDEAPVYYSERYKFWALSRYDDVVVAHRDWQTFTSSQGITLDQLSVKSGAMVIESIIFMDPPEHERLRRLVSRVFTPKAVADLEPMVRGLIAKHLDPLVGESAFDLTADFAGPFPVEVICEILGVPDADRQSIRHWTDDMLHREPGNPEPTQKGMESALYLVGYVLELAREKRRHPTPDMLSGLVDAGLSDDEIASFGVLIAAAGSETVTKLVGGGVVLFDRNPGEWQKVLADPAAALPGAVEEMLRYWAPSQYQGRRSTQASEWHGVTIPADEPVLLLTGAANRDPRAYDDPDRFDIGRVPKLSVGFGHGIHSCLGAALARLESRVAFEEIGTRWPEYSVNENGLRRVQMSNVAGYSNVPVTIP